MDKNESVIEKRYADWVPGDIIRINRIAELSETGGRILDLGCGTGIIGEKLIKKGNTVYGIDASKGAAKKAAEKGIIAKAGDVTGKLPYKNSLFDGIVMAEILEHVVDTDAFLLEARSKLKKNGYIIITTPNIATLGRRLLLLAGKNPHLECWMRADTAGHVRYFIKETLFELLKYNGFAPEIFVSDEVNFNASGTIKSVLLAKIIPTVGRSLIVKARKK